MDQAIVHVIPDHDEPKVTIPLSKYTEMVQKIQMLEDQKQIDRLQREIDAANDRNSELLLRAYKAEEKLKEAQSHESV